MDTQDRQPAQRQPWPMSIVLLIAICTLIEGTISLADWGLIDLPRLRQTVYDYAGFWPGLFFGWAENYPGQSYLMFLTYSVLHGGPLHLVANMITLWSLGRGVYEDFGAGGFGLIYLSSVLGGAVIFLMWASTPQPMVGASGALFGLAGALLAQGYEDRVNMQLGLWPVVQVALMLIAINVVMWWALDGQLAWQTHLGGFLAGAAAALWLRSRDSRDGSHG